MALLARLLLPAVALFGQASAVAEVGAGLRTDPVYIEAGAEAVLDSGEADRLRADIVDGDRAIFVAVLTNETVAEAGGLNDALDAVYRSTDLGGTYAVVSEQGFRAASTQLASGHAGELATAAFNDNRDRGRYAVLADFVDRVQRAPVAGAPSPGAEQEPSNRGDNNSLMPVLIGGAVLAGGALLWTQSRRTRRINAEQLQALQGARQDLLAELSVLADDVLRLEPEVSVHTAARADYDAALSRFKWLEAAIPSIDSPDDPPRIQRAMTEARYAMARAEAIARGQEPPLPPAELTRPGTYGEPAVEIDLRDGARRPTYAGYGDGWYGGGFFGGNGLFTGLLLGQMLGGGFGGWGWNDGYAGSHDTGASQDNIDVGSHGSWGDFGGGGGGGDFGGGSAGGGDW